MNPWMCREVERRRSAIPTNEGASDVTDRHALLLDHHRRLRLAGHGMSVTRQDRLLDRTVRAHIIDLGVDAEHRHRLRTRQLEPALTVDHATVVGLVQTGVALNVAHVVQSQQTDRDADFLLGLTEPPLAAEQLDAIEARSEPTVVAVVDHAGRLPPS